MDHTRVIQCILFLIISGVLCQSLPQSSVGNGEHHAYGKKPPRNEAQVCRGTPEVLDGTPPDLIFYQEDPSILHVQCELGRKFVFWRSDSNVGKILRTNQPDIIVLADEFDGNGARRSHIYLEWAHINSSGNLTCCKVDSTDYDCLCKLVITFKVNGKKDPLSGQTISAVINPEKKPYTSVGTGINTQSPSLISAQPVTTPGVRRTGSMHPAASTTTVGMTIIVIYALSFGVVAVIRAAVWCWDQRTHGVDNVVMAGHEKEMQTMIPGRNIGPVINGPNESHTGALYE